MNGTAVFSFVLLNIDTASIDEIICIFEDGNMTLFFIYVVLVF